MAITQLINFILYYSLPECLTTTMIQVVISSEPIMLTFSETEIKKGKIERILSIL